MFPNSNVISTSDIRCSIIFRPSRDSIDFIDSDIKILDYKDREKSLRRITAAPQNVQNCIFTSTVLES